MTGCALITGASRGIGRELARRFAADGHSLVLVARSRDDLEALAAELSAVAVRVEVRDLADPAAPAALVAALEADGVTIDFLVNNAGFGSNGPLHTLPVDAELRQIQVNVAALTALTGLLLPGMVARRRGAILNIASTAGFQAGPYMAVYYATKAYVISFTEAIAVELKGTGVTATAHCPGPVATSFGQVSGNGDTLLFKAGMVASPRAVAADAYSAMSRGEVIAVHGTMNLIGVLAVRMMPRWLSRLIAAKLNR